ncbi:MAG: sugar-binding transcriptional regulator [Actinobacteria bacterium]|nr:sugar-binding transcriptional regulator [Actinomycetota bacterium]
MNDLDLMIKICKLYYKEGLQQLQIAQMLKISRFKVSRILMKAKELGIVKINIAEPIYTEASLEEYLEERFCLQRAIVVKNYGLSDNELKEKIGTATANYLTQIVKDGDILCISWGSTVNKMAEALPVSNKKVEVVQINGGSRYTEIDISCHVITARIASKFNTSPHLLYAPALADSKDIRDILLKDSNIKHVYDFFDRANIVIAAIGAIFPEPNRTLVEAGTIKPEEFEILKKEGAVGHIFYHFYDRKGRICAPEFENRVIAMSLEQLEKVPYSIALAGGENKAIAILSALRGKLIKILVTDSRTAILIKTLDMETESLG